MNKKITVEVSVKKDIETVWKTWTTPADIQAWNHASSDWECPRATNDVRVGGKFSFIMSAKDKSVSFDFNGVYTAVETGKRLAYTIEGGRTVTVSFENSPEGVRVIETFEMEGVNPEEMQRAGWQAILNNFKTYAEAF